MFKVWLKKENSYENFLFASLTEAKEFSIKNYIFFEGLWFDNECIYTILEREEKNNDDNFTAYRFIKYEIADEIVEEIKK